MDARRIGSRAKGGTVWGVGTRIVAFCLIVGIGAAGRATPSAEPEARDGPWRRSVSGAERRAVELAVAYLASGPGSWWPELASSSPLRDLGEAAAVDEIAVRAGPPEGARWVLQTPAPGSPDGLAVLSIVFPSGIEETLTLLFEEEDGGWALRDLRSLADPRALDDVFWDRPALPDLGATVPGLPESPGGDRPVALALVLLALALALLRAGTPRARSRVGGAGRAAVSGLGTAVALAGLVLGCRGEVPSPVQTSAASASVEEPPLQSLGALRDFRWAVATGASARGIDELFARLPAARDLTAIASLWRAETLLSQVDLGAAEDLLRQVPDPSPSPLGSLVRARLAYARGDADEAARRYDEAAGTGTDHDGLRLEMAQALAGLGRTIEAEVVYTQAAEMGSRHAEVHYAMAQFSVLAARMERGESFLDLAWRLEPVLREALFADPLLSALCARPGLFGNFSFSEPQEPAVVPAGRGERVIALPPSAKADLSGELLRIEVGAAELRVPGGAELAPASAAVETASDRRRRLEERVLARLPALLEETRTTAVLARPQRRQDLLEASAALARHNRWGELVALTEGVAGSVDRMPLTLGRLRAEGLRRRGREGDAQRLLVRLAKASLESRRRDPGALRQLAELFVAGRDYDLAIRLIRRAGQLSPLGAGERRIRQIRLEQELYEDPEVDRRTHFEIVYPRYTSARFAAALGVVLEEELRRIERWVPAGGGYRHTVNLYPLERFVEAYSGSVLVLGIYDGRLRLPLADLPSLHPQLVSVLSHELAHGMIARATDDQAPKWFHEGLAQHVEMVPGRINPIPDLAREGRVLSFPMIEAILDGFSEPQLVDLAYGEAAWVLHYVESEHGVGAIRRLIDAFERGLTTEGALEEVFGMSVAEFDRAVWRWCLRDAPAAWPTEIRRYDRELGGVVHRSGDGAAPGDGAAVGAASLRSWHARYRANTREVRRGLARVLGAVRRGGSLPGPECVAVEQELDAVLGDPSVLDAPDAGVRTHLRVAYASLREMAAACREGDGVASRRALALAEGALARAAGELKRYGLSP